jgi:hypothetical protein
MDRLKHALVVGALAVAVSVLAAGPAAAAKGGNSDNAHACQQGGHANRFEAETGMPFKNAGDCASHGAKGGTTTFLVIDPSSYPCTDSTSGATCWGRHFRGGPVSEDRLGGVRHGGNRVGQVRHRGRGRQRGPGPPRPAEPAVPPGIPRRLRHFEHVTGSADRKPTRRRLHLRLRHASRHSPPAQAEREQSRIAAGRGRWARLHLLPEP